MASLDLRPLSLGEILDQSFSLYRQNFVLFVGIAAIPQLFVLAFTLVQTFLGLKSPIPGAPATQSLGPGLVVVGVVIIVLGRIAAAIAYLWTQGATVHAVADIYLGRPTTIGDSLRKVRSKILTLFGVGLLNGLAIAGGLILLIVPGIYIACRLITAVPAAVLEDLKAGASLNRSYALTKDNAGRAFIVLVLYGVLLVIMGIVFGAIPTFLAATARNNPPMLMMWGAITDISTSVGAVLVSPFLLIATSLFYFDLRVRKEAFDLQMMMNPDAPIAPPAGNLPGTFP